MRVVLNAVIFIREFVFSRLILAIGSADVSPVPFPALGSLQIIFGLSWNDWHQLPELKAATFLVLHPNGAKMKGYLARRFGASSRESAGQWEN
jgi:hypothetical protein